MEVAFTRSSGCLTLLALPRPRTQAHTPEPPSCCRGPTSALPVRRVRRGPSHQRSSQRFVTRPHPGADHVLLAHGLTSQGYLSMLMSTCAHVAKYTLLRIRTTIRPRTAPRTCAEVLWKPELGSFCCRSLLLASQRQSGLCSGIFVAASRVSVRPAA